VELASLLEEFVSEYRPKLQPHGIHLESWIVSLTPSMRGYPALIAMLLRNLFENAAGYTPEQGLIRITLESDRLVMQNDCPELSDAYVSRLGERFFRPPGQENTAGSGLGLSIVKRIADIHRCAVDIRTENNAPGFSPYSFKVVLSWHRP
jgi:two-component system sensor histidine kinase QseC